MSPEYIAVLMLPLWAAVVAMATVCVTWPKPKRHEDWITQKFAEFLDSDSSGWKIRQLRGLQEIQEVRSKFLEALGQGDNDLAYCLWHSHRNELEYIASSLRILKSLATIDRHNSTTYPGYNGKGFGLIDMHHNLLCGTKWLREHYDKFPNGQLPEQGLELYYDSNKIGEFNGYYRRGDITLVMRPHIGRQGKLKFCK